MTRRIIQRVRGWGAWVGLFLVYGTCISMLSPVTRSRANRLRWRRKSGIRLLIIGRFDSRNWCRSHLLPLARASCVDEIVAVVDGPTIEHRKIRYRSPPRLLDAVLGRAASKALWMLVVIAKWRPDIVIGYHIFPGAVTAAIIARLARARSLYQMTAGPVEILGGGIAADNILMSSLNAPSPLLQRMATGLCRRIDTVVVRGEYAEGFVLSRVSGTRVRVIAGSIDPRRFDHKVCERIYDVATVGRLIPRKQVHHLLQTTAVLARSRPGIRVAVAGDGPLMKSLRQEAEVLGVLKNVKFLGHQERVEDILHRTKVFLLTSRNEGLSIAMAEAMAAGAVPVVADVGDLRELVRDGHTGWLVQLGDIDTFARRIDGLLADKEEWNRMSDAARDAVHHNNSLDAVIAKWERCLSETIGQPAAVSPAESATAAKERSSTRRLGRSASGNYRLWRRGPLWMKKALTGPLRLVRTQNLLGSAFGTELRFVRQAARMSIDETQAYQIDQLRRLLQLACERTSFYRRRFREAGFNPNAIKNLDDLRRLPTIDHRTLRESLGEMSTIPLHSAGIDRLSTAGTSGEPLHFYIGTDRSVTEFAYLVVSWQRIGYRLGMPMAVFRGLPVSQNRDGLYHEYDPVLRHHYYSSFHMTDEHMRRYLEHIATIGPCFLHVYPSTAVVLARFVRRTGIRPPHTVRGIIAESEIVYAEQRRMVEQVFGCRYFSCYGQTEKVVLAAECEYSIDYHVWPTYGYFELLDEDGKAVTTPGRRGEIVGTGFINTVVPFIRYRTGDYATYVSEGCEACGRAHTIIRDIRGHRTQEVLIAADGSEISWVALNMHDGTFAHVRQFQFRQDTAGQAVLRVVAAQGFGEEDVQRIRRNLGRKLDGRLELTIERVDAIPLSPRGKAIYVDQRMPPAES